MAQRVCKRRYLMRRTPNPEKNRGCRVLPPTSFEVREYFAQASKRKTR